jgi:two-component system, sporulation sensor kinase B
VDGGKNMEVVKDVLIQMAIVILPVFFYEILWLNRYHTTIPKQNKVLLAGFYIFSAILSLYYYIYDEFDGAIHFGMIIMINAFLYGGYVVGGSVVVSVIAYLIICQSGDITAVMVVMFLFLLVPISLHKRWQTFSKNRRLVVSFGWASIYIGINIGLYMLYQLLDQRMYPYPDTMMNYMLIIGMFVLTTVLQVYLKEYMHENTVIRAQTQQSEKLNVISELAASVAHEVRNPLTVVRGFIQLMQQSKMDGNMEYFPLVLSELDRAESIISDYLNLAKPQIEEKKHIHLTKLIHETTTLMSSFAMLKGVYLQVYVDEGLYVVGDEVKLKQAIVNVLKNGIEAITETRGYIKIMASKEQQQIVIKVRDTGAGMTKDQLIRLGEPFYSLKEKGTGLGLMVTFRIIESHGGTISYFSEEGIGTEAVITFPAAKKKK